jgi:uncharacterized protein YkwD
MQIRKYKIQFIAKSAFLIAAVCWLMSFSSGENCRTTSIDFTPRNGLVHSGKWDLERLNTAKDAGYLSRLEQEVVLEMNMARTNPAQYAIEFIQPRLQYFKKKNYIVPGETIRITNEGKKPAEECIKVLKKTKAVGLLVPSRGMSLASRDHANDQGISGKVGHTGSDKSSFESRLKRYGKWDITIGENIDYGNETARDIVISLLVDDGVPSRGHRKNLLESQFAVVGVACGKHKEYRTMCVIDYAGKYADGKE